MTKRDKLKSALNKMLVSRNLKIVDINEHSSISSRHVFEDLNISPNMIIDVGANVGQFAIKFAHEFPEAIIHSFEANSNLYSRFRSNVSKYKNVRLHEFGMGEETGVLQLSIDERNSLVSSFKFDHGRGYLDCNVTSLDEFIEREQISSVGLLKIDVEGFEPSVLKGASRCLSKQIFDGIIIEATFTPKIIKSASALQLIGMLSEYNYVPQGFYDLDYAFIKQRGVFKLGNLLFVRAQGLV